MRATKARATTTRCGASRILNDPVNLMDPLGLFRLGRSVERQPDYIVEVSAPSENIGGGGADFSGLWSLWLGGGGRRIQPLQPFGGEDGGGASAPSPSEPQQEKTQEDSSLPYFVQAFKTDQQCDKDLTNLIGPFGELLDDSRRYVGERGHYNEIEGRQTGLKNKLNALDKCSSHWKRKNAETLEKIKEAANRFHRPPHYKARSVTARQVGTVVTAGVIGYGVYRVVRLLPSLLPPLWWTIPANLAVP